MTGEQGVGQGASRPAAAYPEPKPSEPVFRPTMCGMPCSMLARGAA